MVLSEHIAGEIQQIRLRLTIFHGFESGITDIIASYN